MCLGLVTSTVMDLLPVVCLCLWTRFGSAAGNAPVVINMVVREGSDAVLPCSLRNSRGSITQELFDWKKDAHTEVFLYDKGSHYNTGRAGQDEQFRGRVFHFPQHLEEGNASIVIRQTKASDSGNYTCDFPHHRPMRQSNVQLIVSAAPEPIIKTLEQTNSWSLLQCEVLGSFPKPEVQWQDTSGNILPAKEPQVSERGGSFDIILQTTVTKTDHYRCVATQQEINHQTSAKTHVLVPVNDTGAMVTVGVVIGAVSTLLVVAVVVFVLIKKNVIICRKGQQPESKGEKQEERVSDNNVPENSTLIVSHQSVDEVSIKS